ncbi:MFS transporter [Halomonas sp. HK25]|uniref:MFS transporter n=1 Tax=Halomonas sp. HK25 TaxID=3394321 RepID=UPI0039FDBA47
MLTLEKRPSALDPFRNTSFFMLWMAWASSNVAFWMNEVASAWLMTSLTDSALMVSLVYTSSTLPMFIFGLPSGALADLLNRRLFFAATQLWLAITALTLTILVSTNSISASLLLALTAANGIGMAMRLPVFSAIIPTIVFRNELPSALALSGVAMNIARIIGPVIAGLIIANTGSQYVFALNGLLSIIALTLILRWKPASEIKKSPREPFYTAILTGILHVRNSIRMRVLIARIFIFFLHASSLIALLPLVSLNKLGGGPTTYTFLIASMGTGAIACAFLLPVLRRKLKHETMVVIGTLTYAASILVVSISSSSLISILAMFFSGAAWIGTANTITTSAQLTLPDTIRARGMSIYQMALMGGMASGAALWGFVASIFSLETSLITASLSSLLALIISKYFGLTLQDDGGETTLLK